MALLKYVYVVVEGTSVTTSRKVIYSTSTSNGTRTWIRVCRLRLHSIAANNSEKYDYPTTKITTHVSLPVTSQINCVVIFVANPIGDPRNRVSRKYSPR